MIKSYECRIKETYSAQIPTGLQGDFISMNEICVAEAS